MSSSATSQVLPPSCDGVARSSATHQVLAGGVVLERSAQVLPLSSTRGVALKCYPSEEEGRGSTSKQNGIVLEGSAVEAEEGGHQTFVSRSARRESNKEEEVGPVRWGPSYKDSNFTEHVL